MSKRKCTVYVDEAGDLGIGRGTQWFVITAVIVPEEEEKNIRAILTRIKTRLNIKEIHLRKGLDFNKISYIVSELRDSNFVIANVLADTNILPLKDSVKTYNYMCRILLERVSWYLRDHNMVGDIVLSSRGTSRDKELIDYIKNKLLNYDFNKLANVFGKVTSKTASSWDMLQLPDICATSMFKAYEVNSYGFIVPCFMNNLKEKIYTYNGSIDRYGLKFYSDNMKPDASYFYNHRLCNKK